MSTDALDIYKTTLEEQLSSSGVFTEPATFIYDDEEIEITGIFDDSKIRNNKDSANVFQKKSGPRFVVSDFNYDIDVYDDVILTLTYRDISYTIDEIDRDTQGAAVLWLK